MAKRSILKLLFCLTLWFVIQAFAVDSVELLPPDQAFQFTSKRKKTDKMSSEINYRRYPSVQKIIPWRYYSLIWQKLMQKSKGKFDLYAACGSFLCPGSTGA
jgi:hypothetical protein